MNKTQFISLIANNFGFTIGETEKMLGAIMSTIVDTIAKGEEIRLTGFGTFCSLFQKEKVARNPKTGEKIVVMEKIVPKFKPGKNFKEAMLKKN